MTYFHQCENLPNIPIHVTPIAEQNTSRTRFFRLLSMTGISSIFRKYLLKFIRPAETKTYSVNESVGIKLISRLRLSFCHVRELKFRQNFKDTLNPLCSFSAESEITTHFFCAVSSTLKTEQSL